MSTAYCLLFSFYFQYCIFFFFNDPSTTEIYTLSLHDALPICSKQGTAKLLRLVYQKRQHHQCGKHHGEILAFLVDRSEEHTSELQSRVDLVCRLLLEKKKKKRKQKK